ncbi:MAG: radical SAM protein [Clostridiales bacterium]|nr:radical SAM protein [Clostridiales bacterium]
MFKQKLYELANWKQVIHTTWNPDGPGVIRMHMIPPKFTPFKLAQTMVIINGSEILPINESGAILLTEYVKNVNEFGEGAMTDEDLEKIIHKTFRGVKNVFPFVKDQVLKDDLNYYIDLFEAIAKGEAVETDYPGMTIGEYARFMSAPHRMDLLVSSMSKDGHWNCNQKCVHCYAADQKCAEEKELTTEEWKKIIGILRKEKVSQITFTGGEPTIREDIPELIKEGRWFITRLNTNGVRLTEDYCRRLREAELDNLQVTFYSCDEEIHNRLVGAPNYQKTLTGIKNAIAAGINMSINTPICRLNKDYKKTLEFLHDLGIIYVTCSGLILTGNAKGEESEELRIEGEELYESLREAVEYAYSHDMEISFTSPGLISQEKLVEMGLDVPSCGACLSNMAITPSGNVVPCQSWLSDEPLGNILKDKWKTIWNGPHCKEIRLNSSKETQNCQLRNK